MYIFNKSLWVNVNGLYHNEPSKNYASLLASRLLTLVFFPDNVVLNIEQCLIFKRGAEK